MKKVIGLIMVVCMLLTMLAACAEPAAQTSEGSDGGATTSQASDVGTAKTPRNGETWKIGYSNYSLAYNSYTALENTISGLCEQNGFDYKVTDAQTDITKQQADLEDLSQDCDFIFVNTFDPDILTPTINQIVESGIPVVSLDNTLSSEAKLLTTIQADNETNGILCGQWIADQLPAGPINVVIISGEKSSNVGKTRRDSMITGMIEEKLMNEGEANINIVAQAYTDWLPEKSAAAMEDILARNVDFQVVISEADVMAMECMKVLQDAGRSDILVAACADAQKEALELIKNGEYGCTGLNSFTELGQIAIQTFIDWINGETEFPDVTYTPSACITIDNVDQYYDPNAIF